MKMTMTEAEALGRIKMGVNVDIKRSDGKKFKQHNPINIVYTFQRKCFLSIFIFIFDFLRFVFGMV